MIRKETRIINNQIYELFFDVERQAYQVAEDAMNMLLENTEILKCYENKEAQKQLFYVPCKVGDIVYKLDPRSGHISPHEVTKIECVITKSDFAVEIIFKIAGSCRASDFGTTVFATKTEAIAIWNMQEGKQ